MLDQPQYTLKHFMFKEALRLKKYKICKFLIDGQYEI